jgi:outer membrane protein
MNRISIGLNIVLILAVAVLYYLHFSSSSLSSAQVSLPAHMEGKPVLYINTDSLLVNYTLFQESKAKLEAEQSKLENDMQRQAMNLEKEMMDFQQQYGGMTQNQVDKKREELGRKEQNLLALRDQLASQLLEQEQAINKQIYDSIYNYLLRFSQGKDVQYILGYSPGGSVLYAKDDLDITAQVIEGLNADLK